MGQLKINVKLFRHNRNWCYKDKIEERKYVTLIISLPGGTIPGPLLVDYCNSFYIYRTLKRKLKIKTMELNPEILDLKKFYCKSVIL